MLLAKCSSNLASTKLSCAFNAWLSNKTIRAVNYAGVGAGIGAVICAVLFVFTVLSAFFSVLYSPYSQAMPIPQEQVSEMPVSEQLLTLVGAVEAKRVKDSNALAEAIKPIVAINDAERLLLHYVRGVSSATKQALSKKC